MNKVLPLEMWMTAAAQADLDHNDFVATLSTTDDPNREETGFGFHGTHRDFGHFILSIAVDDDDIAEQLVMDSIRIEATSRYSPADAYVFPGWTLEPLS
jgi:hypothetical protein